MRTILEPSAEIKPALEPYWGKPAVRNLRGDDVNVGIIRSPVRAIVLPDRAFTSIWRIRSRGGGGKSLQYQPSLPRYKSFPYGREPCVPVRVRRERRNGDRSRTSRFVAALIGFHWSIIISTGIWHPQMQRVHFFW